MEEQRFVAINVNGAQGDAEDTIGPVELQPVQLVSAGKWVGQEVVMLHAKGRVVEQIVDDQSKAPDVREVSNGCVALAVTHVNDDVGVERVLLYLIIGDWIALDEAIRRQVENENSRWTDLPDVGGDVHLAAVQHPQTVALVHLHAKHRGQTLATVCFGRYYRDKIEICFNCCYQVSRVNRYKIELNN